VADRETLAGLRVRAFREEREWTQQQLAEACERAGLSSLTRSTVAKVESGLRKLTSGEVRVLALVLGVEATDLLGLGAPARPVRHVFLSYSEEDSDVARSISDRLHATGLEVFNWPDPSQHGKRIFHDIEASIKEADAFIAVLSPRFLASDSCGRQVAMAVQRDQDLRSRDPMATFISVALVAIVRPSDAGVLGTYDWLDMTSPRALGAALLQLADRFKPAAVPTVLAATDAGASDSAPLASSSRKDQVLGNRDEPVFRDREDELHKLVHGVTNSGGPHFWLVVAPPQLGKTWLLARVAADPALSGDPAWIIRKVDARSEPPDVHRNAAALLTRLFELPRPATTAPETLRGIAQDIIRSGQPHLCLLDSAELLSAETARDLRNCMSQIYHFVRKASRKGDIRLAFIVASRDNKEWKGVIPRPSLTPLPLSEFTPDVVQAALVDLAAEMGFSQAEIINYAQFVHRLTEGLPALIARCVRWIRDEEGVDMERLQTRELFEQLSCTYIQQELLTAESLLPYGQRQAEESLRALVQAYRVLAPYRLFTLFHLRHHWETDDEFRVAMAATGWDIAGLWAAIDGTSLLRRPLDEPWQEIHGAIRRLLYRYFYRTDETCAEVQNEAGKVAEVWTERQTGKELARGLVECLWHESITLSLRDPVGKKQELIQTAERLSRDIQKSRAYMPPELRAFAVEQMYNDEEFQEAIGSQEFLNRLAEVIAKPSAAGL
jgi:transcriptional regulator with XRE-family HTH domain